MSLTAAFIPLPAGSDVTAAARGSYAAPGRKAAEGRQGPCGSESTGGDTESRDYAAESGFNRSPGESRPAAGCCVLARRGLGSTKPAALPGLSLPSVQH